MILLPLENFVMTEFEIKDLDPLKYFQWMKEAQFKEGIYISQRNYTLYLLKDIKILECKPTDSPIELNEGQAKKMALILLTKVNTKG